MTDTTRRFKAEWGEAFDYWYWNGETMYIWNGAGNRWEISMFSPPDFLQSIVEDAQEITSFPDHIEDTI